jgi:HEAT repeat protein
MTCDEAIAFLHAHQPMPDCEELTDELADTYIEVLDYFSEHPDVRCIPLLLNSFPDDPGVGMYQTVENVLEQFDPDEMVPHLVQSLQSKRFGVCYWSAQIAASFPDGRLVDPLARLLSDANPGTRFFAAAALGQIGSERALSPLQQALATETDAEVLEVLEEELRCNEALEFLRAHQPMPDFREHTAELAQTYSDVLNYFSERPDARCIPLLLSSFPDQPGVEMYHKVKDVLQRFEPFVVVPYLVQALQSEHSSVRRWSARIAASFPDERLVDPLARVLSDTDPATRSFAARALGATGSERVPPLLQRALVTEADEEVREILSKELKQ